MSIHMHCNIATSQVLQANNRGFSDNNVAVLQALHKSGILHSSCSGYAIKFAMKDSIIERIKGKELKDDFRLAFNKTTQKYDIKPDYNSEKNFDDDLFGFMNPKAKEDGKSDIRKGRLECSRAISMVPYVPEAISSSRAGEKDNTSIFHTQVHYTAYEYLITCTPSELSNPKRIEYIIDSLADLGHVGGNHSSNCSEFITDVIICQITHCPVSKIMYGMEYDSNDKLVLKALKDKIEFGDIDPKTVIVGYGSKNINEECLKLLESKGVTVIPGIKKTIQEIKDKLSKERSKK